MRFLALAALALALTVPASTPVLAGGHGACCRSCPRCGAYCKPSVEKDMEAKTCWCVECETICIPRVLFPWQKPDCGCGCPPAKCARAKKVRVLVQYEYECPVCKYSFEPPPSCGCPKCSHCEAPTEARQPAPTPAVPVMAGIPHVPPVHVAPTAPAPSSPGAVPQGPAAPPAQKRGILPQLFGY